MFLNCSHSLVSLAGAPPARLIFATDLDKHVRARREPIHHPGHSGDIGNS